MLQDSYPNNDPHVIRIAKESTACFGSCFDPSENTCQTCPIVASCQTEFHIRLENIATRMGVSGPQPQSNLVPPMEASRTIRVVAGVKCYICDKELPEGTRGHHSVRYGYWHNECDDEHRQRKAVKE